MLWTLKAMLIENGVGDYFGIESFATSIEADHESQTMLEDSNNLIPAVPVEIVVDENLIQAAPVDQPSGVGELSSMLFAAYEVVDGSCKLVGCNLDDRPVFLIRKKDGTELLCDESGSELISDFTNSLGCNELEVLSAQPRTMRPEDASAIVTNAVSEIAEYQGPFRLLKIIWCKWVKGKLRIEVDSKAAFVEFSGWARRLTRGPDRMPAFECEVTGEKGYTILLTDEGELSNENGAVSCSITHRKVTIDKAFVSSFSNKPALVDFQKICVVSGDKLIEIEVKVCEFCEQEISPDVKLGSRCKGCESLKACDADDDSVAEFKKKNRIFASYKSWKSNRTFQRNYLECAGWFARYFIVADAESNEQLLLKRAWRWSKKWKKIL